MNAQECKKFVFDTTIHNNRLSLYAEYLQKAKGSGWQILRMCDFFNLGTNRCGGKHLVLRHDVDHPGESTRKMFEVEKENGVQSTYYFRFSTIDVPLIHEMLDSGFEVGLHFETISDWIKESGCTDKSQIDIEIMRDRLKNEINRFEEIIGSTVVSCCSHGAPENVKIGISNNALTEGFDMSRLGVLFEAYDAKMYEDVDCHIMDGSILHNCGFSYVDTPLSAMNEGKHNIVFLTHPNHWWKTTRERIRIIGALILGKATYTTNRRFVRISM